jgi:hypothetical protein
MSAIGPKQTSGSALQMSAFGGEADIEVKSFYIRVLTQTGHQINVTYAKGLD